MPHAAKQIRDWAVTALDGYGSITAGIVSSGATRQFPSIPRVVVTYGAEEITGADVGEGDERILNLIIRAVGNDLDAVDALSSDIEKGLQASFATYPATVLQLTTREYAEDLESEDPVAECSHTFQCTYYTDQDNPDLT